MNTYLAPIACVLALSVGQLLFKASARRLNAAGSVFDVQFLAILGVALAIYGLVSIAWVVILQKAELAKIYPIMALSFVFVPFGAWLAYREAVTPQYLLGVGLIIAGIVVVGLKS